MSAGFMFLAFKKRVTGRISHAAGFSIYLNIANTQYDAQTRFECLQMASVPSQRTYKLCTHAHLRDRSAAAAIFANGTYFVDFVDKHTPKSITFRDSLKQSKNGKARYILIQHGKWYYVIYRISGHPSCAKKE
jgi:hypothetical protein